MQKFRFLKFCICLMGALSPLNVFATECAPPKAGLSDEQIALLYLSCADANLLSQNYESAIQDYLKASEMLQNHTDQGLQFLMWFGLTIAYDNLYLSGECEQTLLCIQTLLRTNESGEEEIPDLSERSEVPTYLALLAHQARSVNVQSILLSYVDTIFPDHAIHTFMRENATAIPCKSFGKKLEKLGHNIVRSCEKILEILEKCLDIFDRVTGIVKEEEETDLI